MPNPDTQKAWDQFESDIQGLAGELKRHYTEAADDKESAEIKRTLEQFGRAAESVFRSLETATRDPQVHEKTKASARSFGSAMAETFRELSDELARSLRKPAGTK